MLCLTQFELMSTRRQEIDKNEDERNLWSLLAPWESGRCSFDAGRRHIDVRNVIWIGTSNTGQNIIFDYHDARKDPDIPMTKPEYRELMALLRPGVSEKLGVSLYQLMYKNRRPLIVLGVSRHP